jgi:hypothetical protein
MFGFAWRKIHPHSNLFPYRELRPCRRHPLSLLHQAMMDGRLPFCIASANYMTISAPLLVIGPRSGNFSVSRKQANRMKTVVTSHVR